MVSIELPGRFFYTRNFAFISQLSETDATEVKVAHITASPTATKATRSRPSGKLGLLFRPCYYRCFSHN